ncbi:hypothetical protein [Azospirillum melinis]
MLLDGSWGFQVIAFKTSCIKFVRVTLMTDNRAALQTLDDEPGHFAPTPAGTENCTYFLC